MTNLEKDAEIERLTHALEAWNKEFDDLAAIKDAEIERLKEQVESWKGAHSVASADRDLAQVVARAKYQALLARAASAIWELNSDAYPQQWVVDLVAELQKAAK